MENRKQENLGKAKRIWDLYHDGNSKKSISDSLAINRTEVSNVIKYTTPSMYYGPSEIEEKNIQITELKDQIRQLQETIKVFEDNEQSISVTGSL